jgi:hypothetical protein
MLTHLPDAKQQSGFMVHFSLPALRLPDSYLK